jgi:cytochrome P450
MRNDRVAGAHTTSGTLTLLFHQILHYPSVLHKLVSELDSLLPLHQASGKPYTMSEIEDQLIYTAACIRENFRLSPVINFSLPRKVTCPYGLYICGVHIQMGVNVSKTNYCLHHNAFI